MYYWCGFDASKDIFVEKVAISLKNQGNLRCKARQNQLSCDMQIQISVNGSHFRTGVVCSGLN
jgi:hypothetical protein